jgi:hypothetical protein
MKSKILEKKREVFEHKPLLSFSLQNLSETFLIQRRGERDMTNNIHWFWCKVSVIVVKFLLSFKDLDGLSKKFSNMKCHEAGLFREDRRTDRQDYGNSRFPQFYDHT